MRAPRRWFVACFGVVLFLGAGLLAQTIQYVYDDLGRLIAVIDPSGDTAVYHYDAVGNVTSIDRHGSSQVSVISFTPASGPVGTTVTITGTGFSSTASQDTVAFNGTSATISSATATTLVVTVPSGATTGTIGVTAPGGSASSAASFVVASLNAPTITSFSPSLWTGSGSVSISGTNFDTVARNDRVAFNGVMLATPSSASSTSLTVDVPGMSTSGHLSVATPLGTAVSSGDFFVPPPGYSSSNAQTTGRLTLGTGTAVSFSTTGKYALELFDGTVGHKVSVNYTSSSLGLADAYVYDPRGNILSHQTINTNGLFVEPLSIANATSYSVLVVPAGVTGSVTVTAYDVVDATGTITAGGSSQTVSTPMPGQNARLTFSGTAGDKVSMIASSGNYGWWFECKANINILKPDGTALTSPACMTTGGFIDAVTLPSTGTYTLLVDPVGAATGSITLQLYQVTDLSGSISPGGSAVTSTTTTPGQNGEYTFSGTAGDHISLLGSNSGSYNWTFACDLNVRLLKPDGSTLASGCMEPWGGFFDTMVLPATGTYTVLVDPVYTTTGSITLNLYSVSDYSGTITAGGSGVSVSLSSPGQNGALTFSGTSGHRISLVGSSASGWNLTGGCDLNVSIKNPDNSTLASNTCMEPFGGFIDVTTLGSTGTYTIVVDPEGSATGSITFTLYDVPADASTSITIGGSSSTLTTTIPGQNGQATFSGTSSQQVTVHLTSNSMGSVTVKLLKPDGSQLTSSTSSASSFDLTQQTLPSTGTYTIVVDPQGTNTGSITVSVSNP